MASGNPLFDAIGVPRFDMATPMPAPQPQRQGMGRGQMIAGILADMMAGAMGRPGQFAQSLGRQREQEQEQAQWGLKRQADLQDYGERLRMAQQYEKPPAPYRTQDNAGNVWEQGSDGQFKRIFTDRTPKQYIQDGMMINVPNRYSDEVAPQAPTTIGEDLWNTGQPVGGQTQPASGGFPW